MTTTSIINAIPAMTSNTSPSGVASASTEYNSSFSAWKAFNKNTSIDDMWMATSGASSGWLAYDFGSNKLIGKYVISCRNNSSTNGNDAPKNWTFEGSNDSGATWDILDTRVNITGWSIGVKKEFIISVPKQYKRYRINISSHNGNGTLSIGELEMFEAITTNKILLLSNDKSYSLESINDVYNTKMTSNTTPAPYITSASGQYGSNFPAWKAFNGTAIDSNDAWLSNTKTGWIQIDYSSSKPVNILKLTRRNSDDSTVNVKDFDILGSNDNSVFSTLAEIRGQTDWQPLETRVYNFNNNSSYRYYRINILDNNGYSYTAIGNILFSYQKESLNQIPTLSVGNFINYGIGTLSNVDKTFSSKNYILQDTVSENEDGLWTTQLNRKPLSIRFD